MVVVQMMIAGITLDSTPLMWAVRRENAPIVEWLLENNANTTLKNADGYTAMDYISTELIRNLFLGMSCVLPPS